MAGASAKAGRENDAGKIIPPCVPEARQRVRRHVDAASKEKPRRGAGQLTETCPRRLRSDAQASYRRLAAVATPVKNVGITLGPEGTAQWS
jgi:hypothetical protein